MLMSFTNKKVIISFVSAIVFGASAISVIAARLNFNIRFIPSFLGNELALKIFILLAGILLLYDSFGLRSLSGRINISAIIAGVLLAFLGAFPLMNQMGLLDFLPVVLKFDLSPIVLAGFLLFYSLYLLWDAFLLVRTKEF